MLSATKPKIYMAVRIRTMLVGYARTFTADQVAGFEVQTVALEALGCDPIYSEQTSAVGPRTQLEEAIRYCRKGDTLVVTKLDRLARSVRHLGEIVGALERKEVSLRILNMNLDTSTATGKLMMNVLGSVSQFEREMMKERQIEGIKKAKAEGKYKGRKPTARAKTNEILAMASRGATKASIAKDLGVSERSVYRVLSQGSKILSI